MSAVFSLLSSPHQRVPLYHIYPATWTIHVYGQLYPSCTASTLTLDMTFGAADGVRTRDLLNGNQMLYQLSHSRIYGISVASAGPVRLCLTFLTYSQYLRVSTAKELFYLYWHMEPTTESGAHYWIRTSDPLLVRQML